MLFFSFIVRKEMWKLFALKSHFSDEISPSDLFHINFFHIETLSHKSLSQDFQQVLLELFWTLNFLPLFSLSWQEPS